MFDDDVEVRRLTADAFGWYRDSLWDNIDKIISALLEAQKDEDAEVRENVSRSLMIIRMEYSDE